MAKRDAEEPGNPRARLAGGVYLLYFATAIGASLLLSAPALKPIQDFVNVISFGIYALLALLFYNLFKPVNRRLSLIAALVSLAGCAAGVLDLYHRLPTQVNPLFFFAPYCLLIGYLILGSKFLPRILGALMMLAGLGWLAFLVPAVAKHISVWIEGLGIGAEGLLMLWLLAAGVNEQRWQKQEKARVKAGNRE
jgi:hypothetical protein